MIILHLTCANEREAQTIADELLEKRLIACARQWTVNSSYWWNEKINHDNEVLMMMETVENKFEAIDEVVKRLHSYDQYVLTASPVVQMTDGVKRWLKDTIDD